MQNLINYFFFGGVGIMLLLAFFYFAFFYKQKSTFVHYPIRLQIKKIVTIALFAATSVSFLFILTEFTSLTVLPTVRVAFEGVLVKISGFLFGPFIGIVCAIVTEVVVLVFIPTYFHYKYLLVLICFGFFSGIVRVFIKQKFNVKGQIFTIYFGLVVFFCLTQFFFFLTLYNQTSLKLLNWDQTWKLFQEKYLDNFHFMNIVFFGNIAAFLFLFVFVTTIAIWLNKKPKRRRFISQKTLRNVLPILVLALFAEYLVSVFISTSANQAVFGENAQSGIILLTSALLMAPVKILINTFIIYQVWNAFSQHISKKIIL